MSTKQKRKTKKDFNIYMDYSEMKVLQKRPNLYKKPFEREKLNERIFKAIEKDPKYRKEIHVKGLDKRDSEEIFAATWLR